MRKTALFIVVSPIAGFALAAVLMWVVRLLERRAGVADDHRAFKVMQLASSAALSLGHGSNDAQKTMGVIAALLVATGHLQGGGEQLPIPLWVVLAAHTAIALGTLSGGWNIIRTMGTRITELRPAGGFSAETAAATALFGSTFVGAPVSTTHTAAGAVTGVGVAVRGQAVSWAVAYRMVGAWIVTLPAAAVCAAAVYGATQLPLPGAAAVLAMIGVLGLVSGYRAWRGAARSTDIAREIARGYERPGQPPRRPDRAQAPGDVRNPRTLGRTL